MTHRMRWIGAAALVTTASLAGAIVTPRRAGAYERRPAELASSNAGGVLATLNAARTFEGKKFFADLGYTSTDSQTNFIFTDIGKTMTAAQFRDACAAKGVMVGRDFPPLEKQWARISLGTMEEMQKATEVFRSVLKPATTTSSGKGQ